MKSLLTTPPPPLIPAVRDLLRRHGKDPNKAELLVESVNIHSYVQLLPYNFENQRDFKKFLKLFNFQEGETIYAFGHPYARVCTNRESYDLLCEKLVPLQKQWQEYDLYCTCFMRAQQDWQDSNDGESTPHGEIFIYPPRCRKPDEQIEAVGYRSGFGEVLPKESRRHAGNKQMRWHYPIKALPLLTGFNLLYHPELAAPELKARIDAKLAAIADGESCRDWWEYGSDLTQIF